MTDEIEAEFFGGPADGDIRKVHNPPLPEVQFPVWTDEWEINEYDELQPLFGTISYWLVPSDGPRVRYEWRP